MRLLFSLVCFLATGISAHGQIIFVEFKSPKIANRYQKYMSWLDGKEGLIGEPKSGITCHPTQVTYTSGNEAKNSIFVIDSGDPHVVAYRHRDGRKHQGRAKSVSFPGDHVAWIRYVDRLMTMEGLALEYDRRLAVIEELEERRDDERKGSEEWRRFQASVLGELGRLISWLHHSGYTDAAERLDRKTARERKALQDLSAIRLKEAIESIRTVPTPPALEKAADKYATGAEYKVQQSLHVRITYVAELSDRRVAKLLRLAEQLINGFRQEFVDPYVDASFPDYIPEECFQEFYFGPEDDLAFEKMFEEFYGMTWGRENRERRLQRMGTNTTRGQDAPDYLSYWRLKRHIDLDGVIAHRLGHTLADLHYNAGRKNAGQDWLEEALGYYVSFEYLGRNSVTCFAFNPSGYAREKTQEGEKTVARGKRSYFLDLALAKGPALDALGLKRLATITDPDFAKAWSFFEFVATQLGRNGQEWLRQTCSAATSRRLFFDKWRKLSMKLFGTEKGEDVFRVLDTRWRRYATEEQRKASGTR